MSAGSAGGQRPEGAREQAVEPKPDPLVGQTLGGRYRLTRKVGEGGMGAVYEAIQEALGRTVAVKILRDKYLDRPEVAQRLVQEAQLASSIEHEHIVRILDSGATEDGRPFVVMEHLRGESLAERIRREGALPEAFVIELGVQTANALSAAHDRSIVHRDVKPENLFLVDSGAAGERDRPMVKIVDFGISKSMAGEASDANLRLTATGMVLGTPLYMSPEQARGDEELDHRIDVYALGVILYEALTGEVPFRASNYLGVIAQVLSAELPSPRALRPELSISDGIEQVVVRAMAKDRTLRYPSMLALAEDLERVRSGRAPSAARPAAPPSAGRKPRALWPFAAAIGVAAVVVLQLPLLARYKAVATLPPVSVETREPATEASPRLLPLRVRSEPAGAEIFIGDRSYGTTPTTLRLAAGKQRLGLRRAGFEDAAADAVIGVDEEVRVVLRAAAPRSPEPSPTLPRARPLRAEPRATEQAPASPGAETLPNPY